MLVESGTWKTPFIGDRSPNSFLVFYWFGCWTRKVSTLGGLWLIYSAISASYCVTSNGVFSSLRVKSVLSIPISLVCFLAVGYCWDDL